MNKLFSFVCLFVLVTAVVASSFGSFGHSASADTTDILVVQNQDSRFWFTDLALTNLGIAHDTVGIQDFGSINISNYKIIIVGTEIGRLEEVKPVLDSKSSEIESWIATGGCIAVFGQYVNASVFDLNHGIFRDLGSGYYGWLPSGPAFQSVHSDFVSILDNTHPLMLNFTDDDLTLWGSSGDGYFVSPPGESLVIQAGFNGRSVMYAQSFGQGKIVATSLDPDYHGYVFNYRGDEGKVQARKLIENILSWFRTPSRTAEISLSTVDTTYYLEFQVKVEGNLTADSIGIADAPVLISYSVTGGMTWNDIMLVPTTAEGYFCVTWIPAASGNYVVRALWTGNSSMPAATTTLNLSVLAFENQYVFSVESNSSVSELAFDSLNKTLSFNVSGESGTKGFTRITIAKNLVPDVAGLTIQLDESNWDYSVINMTDSWVLLITYDHSTHQVQVQLEPSAIPELSSWILIVLLMLTIGFVILVKEKRSKKVGLFRY